MDDPRLQAQLSVRRQAEELNDYMKDLFGWQKELKQKEKSLKRTAGAELPPVRGKAQPLAAGPATSPAGTGQASHASTTEPVAGAPRHPAAHTYDNYRSKWDTFDVDAALAGSDVEEVASQAPGSQSLPLASGNSSSTTRGDGGSHSTSARSTSDGGGISGSGAAAMHAGSDATTKAGAPLPAARIRAAAQAAASRPVQPTTAEQWKDEGNRSFKAGAYQKALDCYSSSLALSPTCIAYANRAMAELKLGKFREADEDCGEALLLDATYVKAYQRRAAARKELGDLLGAIDDCEAVLRLEPTNKAAASDRQQWITQLLTQQGLVWEPAREAVPVQLAAATDAAALDGVQERAELAAQAAAVSVSGVEAAVVGTRGAPAAAAAAATRGGNVAGAREPLGTAVPFSHTGSNAADFKQRSRAVAAGRAPGPDSILLPGQVPSDGRVLMEATSSRTLQPGQGGPPGSSGGTAQAAVVSSLGAVLFKGGGSDSGGSGMRQETAVEEGEEGLPPLEATGAADRAAEPQVAAQARSPTLSAGAPAIEVAQAANEAKPAAAAVAREAEQPARLQGPPAAVERGKLNGQAAVPVEERGAAGTGALSAQQGPAGPAAQQGMLRSSRSHAAANEGPVTGSGGMAGSGAMGLDVPKHAALAGSVKAPRTGLDFEKGWKACKGDLVQQADYVELIPPPRLPAILKQTLIPSLLAALLRTLLGPTAQRDPAHAAAVLEALPAVPRFEMNLLSLPAREKAGLSQAWDLVQAALEGETAAVATRLAAVRQQYRL